MIQKIFSLLLIVILSTGFFLETTQAIGKEKTLSECQTRREMRGELRRIKWNLPRKCEIQKPKNNTVVEKRNSTILPKIEKNCEETLNASHLQLQVTCKKEKEIVDTNSGESVRSRYSILGKDHPIIAGFSLFLEQEPLNLEKISVRIEGNVPSVESIALYTENREFLGNATRRTGNEFSSMFTLELSSSAIHIKQKTTMNFYARLNTRSFENGGQSGESVSVTQILLEGNGVWSSERYTKLSDAITFPSITLTRAIIKNITKEKDSLHALFGGSNQILGHWKIESVTGDANSNPHIRQIVWRLSKSGVEIQNPRLSTTGSAESMPCIIDETQIRCDLFHDYPSIGNLHDGATDILLTGDIVNPQESAFFSIDASLGRGIVDGGDITWTDGTSTFSWIDIDGGSIGNSLRK
jgi:hypothetical protein